LIELKVRFGRQREKSDKSPEFLLAEQVRERVIEREKIKKEKSFKRN